MYCSLFGINNCGCKVSKGVVSEIGSCVLAEGVAGEGGARAGDGDDFVGGDV